MKLFLRHTHQKQPPTGTRLRLENRTKVSKTGELLADRYEILEVLGEGGMGAVYLAKDTRLPRRWAIKVMNDTFSNPQAHKDAVESFRTEAHLLSGLNHANLPRITDYFSEKERHYLVMDFIEGQTLEDLIKDKTRLEITQTLDFALQLTEVLGYLHTQPQPIIFRDFKPANVMITPQGKAKLIDFGIARHFQQGKVSDTKALGTPGYAAPEQYGQGQSDARTDIYALGATLHHALTGINPTDTPFTFKPVRESNAEVPEALDNIIMKCVQLKPDQRFQSTADLRQALESLKTDPDAFEVLPERMKTATLKAPGKRGFEPEEIVLGPVKRGKVPSATVVLKGSYQHKLKTDQKWLRVRPDKVNGRDCELQITASTSSLSDGGSFEGNILVVEDSDTRPLRVRVKLEQTHVTFWSMALAFVLVLGSFVPLLGFIGTGFLFSMFLSTPKGERAVLKVFLIVSILASIFWVVIGGLIGFGLTQMNWDEMDFWKKTPTQGMRITPELRNMAITQNLMEDFDGHLPQLRC